MELKKGQIVEVEITKLAFGGKGLGEMEGKKIFVNDTMPGDKVEAALTRIKPKFLEARLERVVEKSKDRTEPRCSYADVCGGCQIQHMPYDLQLSYKRQHVIDCFERLGGFTAPPVKPVIPCKDQFYYRNKMEFSFGYDAEMNFTLGMHVPGRRFDIMDLKECYLESPASAELVNLVRDFMRKTGFPPFKYSDGSGFLKHLVIREGKRTGERLINLRTSDAIPPNFDNALEEFVVLLKETGLVTSIYWTQDISKRGQPRQTKEALLYGPPFLTEKMDSQHSKALEFEIHPKAFFQVNTLQAETLYDLVLELVLQDKHDLVLDLFCGTGTIGLFLAEHVKQVIGIELNADAVNSARSNARKNKIDNIEFLVGDVGKMIDEIGEKPSTIVVDPPRVGLTNKMIEGVVGFGCERLVYVSCNPATLARDCAEFKKHGYQLSSVQPVDMFPHTYHIENVCLLER